MAPIILQAVRRPRLVLVSALLVFAAVVGFLSWRTWKHLHEPGREQDDVHWGMIDFRDVIYFPTRAALDGVNPYDGEPTTDAARYRGRYPVGNVFPIYSPILLVLDAPLQLLPYQYGMLLYGGINVALVVVVAWLALRVNQVPTTASAALFLASGMLLSRPGQSNFYYGQLALPMVLCTLLATHLSAVSPLVATVAVVLTTIKPTFGGPLLIMLLCQRRWKVALWGGTSGGMLAAAGFALVFTLFSSPKSFAEVIFSNVSETQTDPGFNPRLTGVRLDAVALVQRLLPTSLDGLVSALIPVGILLISGVVLWRLSYCRDDHRSQSLSAGIISVTILICIFHAVYDGLLLVCPIVGLFCSQRLSNDSPRIRWTEWLLLALLLVPAANMFSSRQFWSAIASQLGVVGSLDLGPWLWNVAAALNGACLISAWAIFIVLGLVTAAKAHHIRLSV